MTSPRTIDEDFRALPCDRVADAALSAARDLGVEHADVRVQRLQGQLIRLRDGHLEGANDSEDVGVGVRVVHDGAWGFAASAELTPEAARQAVADAVALAKVSRPLSTERV